ncbi:MAG: 2-C-methyl-D-erythritol 2,4-cyclodiphosphate synthase [Candidatus Omnitrophica bacterium]|nr:2-C-methyl-D-erythritol 2,4-cyclodiphosphate synthase [Candidatus Omnitrophota bacterium]
MNYRTGIGYDVHRFAPGRKLMLGGIEVKHDRGLDGHSDADVVLHAICDALLGAAGKGDIGEHFPPGDPNFKNISSSLLLKKVCGFVAEAGYEAVNVDVVILAEEPHLKEYKPKMRAHIAAQIGLSEDAVNIKATTNEGMGFVGNREGIASYASVLITKKSMGK